MLIGPAAVGKMTVGQELSTLTGWPLIYNHRVIDLVTDYFPYGTGSSNRLIRGFNRAFFQEAAAAGMSLIATFGWRFESTTPVEVADNEVIRNYIEPFLGAPNSVCFAELTAPLGLRLERNRTENRSRFKKLDWASDEELTALHSNYRWNSDGHFPLELPHVVLDNSALEPADAARTIAAAFDLPLIGR
jgi:hypothetical protein